jgi:hypothetical protein
MERTRLVLFPIGFREAKTFVDLVHRHHQSPQGWKFGVGAKINEKLVGVVMVGRPVSRILDDGLTAEVIRLATDGTPNACSFLYSAARRAAIALGYRKIITYILASEHGCSLKASGWNFVRMTSGGSWCRPSRKRIDKAPLGEKQLWETRSAGV